MPQMSPIYWLIFLMYFIFELMMLVMIIFSTHSMKLMMLPNDNSMAWMCNKFIFIFWPFNWYFFI